MGKEPKKPFKTVWPEDLFMEDCFMRALRNPEKEEARKLRNWRCGQIKRKLIRKERLTDELLKFALDVVVPDPITGNEELDQFCKGIATKLKHGMPLDDYEFHMIVDVWLLHVRLSA
jgi:hypothetical protein